MTRQNSVARPESLVPNEGARFVPTPEELRVLARHWFTKQFDDKLFHFYYQVGISGSEHRETMYAWDRLNQLTAVLGEDVMREVRQEVADEERTKMGEEQWRVFKRGTWAERQQVQAESERTSRDSTRKQEDCATAAKAFAFLREHPTDCYFDEEGDLWYLAEEDWRGKEDQPVRLILRVRLRCGIDALVYGEHALERPAGWLAPYGLR